MAPLGESSSAVGSGNRSDFLFVNETGNPAAYKQRNRQDVRSHVRKHTAKRFKEMHKIGRKGKEETILPKHPLAIRTQSFPKKRFYCSCPSSLTVALSSVSNLTFSFLDTGIPTSGRAPLPTKRPAGSRDAPTLYIKSPPSSVTANPLTSSIWEVTESRESTVSYCKACGKPLDREQQLSQMLHARSMRLSPVEILGSGRVDPFSSHPIVNPNHKLIDLLATYMIPGILPDDVLGIGQLSSISAAWLGLRTPLLYHALLFAATVHHDFIRWSRILLNSPALLSYKLTTIRLLGEIMRNGDEASRTSDEVILVILILASHEVLVIGEGKRNPFNLPLKYMNWANVYGNNQYVPEHMKALSDLITFRGGIEKIKLHGVAEIIIGGDIISATNSLSKPSLPPLRVHEKYIPSVRAWATSPLRSSIQLLGSGFWNVQDYGMTDAMLQVFDALGSITLAIDHFVQGKPDGLTAGAISRTRIAIQQQLLFLPTVDELNIITSSKPCLYESCRLTALIFGAVMMW